MNSDKARNLIDSLWDDSIVGELETYIEIPAKSPHFDPRWAENGYIDAAVDQIAGWLKRHAPAEAGLEVVRLEGRTPVILLEVPGEADDTVLLYGHLDKQPEMSGWDDGKDPWRAVRQGDRLYGRGGADDGYAAYASLAAILALRDQDVPHARCVVLIEACEESGSYDLPAYIDHLADRIGTPSLVVCLDSGAGNYEQLWITTSLRGMAAGTLRVDILDEGVHSGYASGIVPSSFRIARQLITRLEDEATGRVIPEALQAEIPQQRRSQLEAVAEQLGEEIHTAFPFVAGAGPAGEDPLDRLLNRNWRAALAVTGAGGLPAIGDAGNVLRPYTELKLSLRLPPTLDGDKATAAVRKILESDPPYNAKVTFTPEQSATGWNAPKVARWLDAACQDASQDVFGAGAMYMGEGGTIPFMAMLGESFPDAQFLITGVLGPHSNAHGPNEFLHVPYARKLTLCVAQVLAAHAGRDPVEQAA